MKACYAKNARSLCEKCERVLRKMRACYEKRKIVMQKCDDVLQKNRIMVLFNGGLGDSVIWCLGSL